MLLLLVTAACGNSDSTSSTTVAATSSTTAEEALAVDGPVMRYPTAASNLAASCVDNSFGQVAVVKNIPTAIGPQR